MFECFSCVLGHLLGSLIQAPMLDVSVMPLLAVEGSEGGLEICSSSLPRPLPSLSASFTA